MNKDTKYNRSEKGKARYARMERKRVRVRAGGIQFHVGYAPTPEHAATIRETIKKEAPNGRTLRNA